MLHPRGPALLLDLHGLADGECRLPAPCTGAYSLPQCSALLVLTEPALHSLTLPSISTDCFPSAGCLLWCSYDGIHANAAVYAAVVQLVGNLLALPPAPLAQHPSQH